MATTLLEQTRSLHEDIERFEQIITALQLEKLKTHKDLIVRDHKVNKYLNLIAERSNKLRSIYEDKDGARSREIAKIGGTGPELFSLFYDTLRESRAYYARYPDLTVDRPEDVAYRLVMEDDELSRFAGEEGPGRFLDLHENFLQYLNLPKNKDFNLDYATYLKTFYIFEDNLSFKDKPYKNYLTNLWTYLESFVERALPLYDYPTFFAKLEEEFEALWNEKGADFRWSTAEEDAEVKRFESETKSARASDLDSIDGLDDAPPAALVKEKEDAEAAEWNKYSSPKELESLGLEGLKAELLKRGLKCGGTAAQRAERLWDNIKGISKAKPAPAPQPPQPTSTGGGNKRKRRKRNPNENSEKQYIALRKAVLRFEYKINKTALLLMEHIENTKLNIDKKLSRGPDEILEEQEEEEGSDVEAEDVEEEVVIGKQNYPLGWDGKPIPYWLYKLHGLGIEYKCEICGNQSYWGRRAFERHFQEWRHAHGMRCLGVPNTRHFHEVTKIQDALALWQKLKEDTTSREWKPDDEMEFEDAEGNVFNKKTYEDLQRQGLLS